MVQRRVERRGVLVALLAVVVVAGIVVLQLVDDAESRTPIRTPTSTTTTSPRGGDSGNDAGTFAGVATPCATLTNLASDVVLAVTGDETVRGDRAATIARDLRALARREAVPAQVRPALRKLARFFDRASDGLSILDAGAELGRTVGSLLVVGQYTARMCPATPSTTRPLR
jgi:hypothetical protein